jgi:hypothetical protein
VSAALEAELSSGQPGPELITAAEAYLRGGTCVQLHDVADVVLLAVPAPAPVAPAVRVASLGSMAGSANGGGAGASAAAAAAPGHRRMLSRDATSKPS